MRVVLGSMVRKIHFSVFVNANVCHGFVMIERRRGKTTIMTTIAKIIK